MKGKTSRKGTTARTRGSKATIKSRVVDQWIAKRITGNSWGMGGCDGGGAPKGETGTVTRDLVYSHPPSYSLTDWSSPSSPVLQVLSRR